LNIRKFFH